MLVKSYQSSSVITRGRFARDVLPFSTVAWSQQFMCVQSLLKNNTSDNRGCLA